MRIAVYLTGEFQGWAAPKDVILYVAGQLTVWAERMRLSNILVQARAALVRRVRQQLLICRYGARRHHLDVSS